MEKEQLERHLHFNRRRFLKGLGFGIGGVALGSLLIPDLFSKSEEESAVLGLPHFAPRAKRIIYLFQNGALPSLTCSTINPCSTRCRERTFPPLYATASGSRA